MSRFLRTLGVVLVCGFMIVSVAAADGDSSEPPVSDGDPTDPYGGTMANNSETVLPDWISTVLKVTWVLPWVIR
jgi:hypothetical protein